MCETCGCDGDGATVTHLPSGEHAHVFRDGRVVMHRHEHGHPADGTAGHSHEHTHEHGHQHAHATVHLEPVQAKILARNEALAARNRELLAAQQVAAINVMSSPGAGKTTLLTRTLTDLMQTGPVAVIEGDQATALDADRIARTGAPVVQINTGKGCHLEADMVFSALRQLALRPSTLLVIENVGNLVCPALFDLGEGKRVVLLSVTEGDDKPDKYPHMFAIADLVVLTKVDLLPHVDFDVARATRAVQQLNPHAAWLQLSAKTGAGIPAWLAWLDAQRPQAGAARSAPAT